MARRFRISGYIIIGIFPDLYAREFKILTTNEELPITSEIFFV